MNNTIQTNIFPVHILAVQKSNPVILINLKWLICIQKHELDGSNVKCDWSLINITCKTSLFKQIQSLSRNRKLLVKCSSYALKDICSRWKMSSAAREVLIYIDRARKMEITCHALVVDRTQFSFLLFAYSLVLHQ